MGAQEGHAVVVEMLLAAGADKDLQSNVRASTITPPSLSPNPCPKGKRILQGPALIPFPLSPQQNGESALILSAWKGHDKCTDLLIKAGARLDLEDNWKTTALALAKEENHPKCVALLEAANAP